jgi:hypothetical protein
MAKCTSNTQEAVLGQYLYLTPWVYLTRVHSTMQQQGYRHMCPGCNLSSLTGQGPGQMCLGSSMQSSEASTEATHPHGGWWSTACRVFLCSHDCLLCRCSPLVPASAVTCNSLAVTPAGSCKRTY